MLVKKDQVFVQMLVSGTADQPAVEAEYRLVLHDVPLGRASLKPFATIKLLTDGAPSGGKQKFKVGGSSVSHRKDCVAVFTRPRTDPRVFEIMDAESALIQTLINGDAPPSADVPEGMTVVPLYLSKVPHDVDDDRNGEEHRREEEHRRDSPVDLFSGSTELDFYDPHDRDAVFSLDNPCSWIFDVTDPSPNTSIRAVTGFIQADYDRKIRASYSGSAPKKDGELHDAYEAERIMRLVPNIIRLRAYSRAMMKSLPDIPYSREVQEAWKSFDYDFIVNWITLRQNATDRALYDKVRDDVKSLPAVEALRVRVKTEQTSRAHSAMIQSQPKASPNQGPRNQGSYNEKSAKSTKQRASSAT